MRGNRPYNVLRCEEGETPCTPEWLAWVTAGDGDPPPAPTEYTDTEVTAGTTYRYTVEAKVGDDYDTSPWSNEVTATTEGEPEPEPEAARSGGAGADGPDGDGSRRERHQPELDRAGGCRRARV